MSVTFHPSADNGRPLLRCVCTGELHEEPCPACLASLNVNNRNAVDLCDHLGLPCDFGYGTIRASKLVFLCRTRLAMDDTDEGIRATEQGRVHEGGRPAGRLRDYTVKLLMIAQLAGDQHVTWS